MSSFKMFSLLVLQFCYPGESTPLTPHCYAPGIMHTSLRIVVTLSNIKSVLLIRIFKSCDCASCKRIDLHQLQPIFWQNRLVCGGTAYFFFIQCPHMSLWTSFSSLLGMAGV